MQMEGTIRWTDGDMPRWEVFVAGESHGKFNSIYDAVAELAAGLKSTVQKLESIRVQG